MNQGSTRIKYYALIVMLGMGMVHTTTYASLLIVKKTETGFAPLDDADKKHNDAMASMLLKYEWPMCIANTDLTADEQKELLAPNKPNAEELFIQKKLTEKFGQDIYHVVFIPTTVYELFCLSKVSDDYDTSPSNALDAQQKKLETAFLSGVRIDGYRRSNISIQDIINTPHEKAANIRKRIYKRYTTESRFFYEDQDNEFNETAFFHVNRALASELFNYCPDLQHCTSTSQISKEFESKALQFADHVMKKSIYGEEVEAQTIALDYKAKAMNKGLLFRGTDSIKVDQGRETPKTSVLEKTGLDNPDMKYRGELAGTTIYEATTLKDVGGGHKKKTLKPYSLSFGNSLFAGRKKDSGATAYTYLCRGSSLEFVGYVLFIDKQAYIQHQCHNLFFISPLAPLAALFNGGEWFHSRSKVAIPYKKAKKTIAIDGLSRGGTLSDPTGVLLITRNPLHHAALFSKFLADNMQVINGSSVQNLTEVERKAYDAKMKESQALAGKFYKSVKTLERFATKVSEKFHHDKDAFKKNLKQHRKERLHKAIAGHITASKQRKRAIESKQKEHAIKKAETAPSSD